MKNKLSIILNQYFNPSSLILIFLFIFYLGHLSGATIIVGPPPSSIQTAINNASSGDTIQLSAGTYVEQIQVISKNLTIMGTGMDNTIIQAPGPATPLTQFFNAGPNIWPIVMVDNQTTLTPQIVNIENLTVDGDQQQDTSSLPPPSTGQYGFSDRFFAIGYHNASGTIHNVHTTNTRSTIRLGQLAGGGIVNISTTQPAVFNVNSCLVDFYQRNGIVCMGSTLTANVSNNIVNRGYVLPPNITTATPNGISFGSLVMGSITNNSVQNNIATVLGASATAVNINNAGSNLVISGNTINNNDIGLFAVQCGNNLLIQNNVVTFTTTPGPNISEGIIVRDTNGLTTIDSNSMSVRDFNMELLTINGTNQPFQLSSNQFIGSQTGLYVNGSTTTGPVITMNSDSFTGTLGYYIREVSAPNDIWPSTASVSFDGLISGNITYMQFLLLLTKIFDKHNDPALGLVLDFIIPIPLISDIMPSSGPAAGGNIVTITGSNFVTGLTTVNFGLTPALGVTVLSSTVLTAIAPPGTGIVDVTVTTPNGTSPMTPFDHYSYIPVMPPMLLIIDPNFGPESGGTAVKILGNGFMTGATSVFFGSTPATSVFVHSFSMLTAIAPPGIGVVDITIVTSMGQSVIIPGDRFTYIASPLPPCPFTPLPPSHFKGSIKENKFLNKTEYSLKATWQPSPSPDIVFYRIYKNAKLIGTISADPGSSLFFETCLSSKKSAKNIKIAAVNSCNVESFQIKLRITHD